MVPYTEDTDASPSIALFLPTLTPGGIERCMLNLAEGFIDRDVRVDLVVADRRGEFETKVPSEVNIVDLEVNRVLKSIFPLARYLRKRQPDVLLSGHTHANIAAVWSGKLARTDATVVVGVHNPHSRSYSSSSNLKSKLISKTIPLVYRLADKIITVSEGVAKDIFEFAPVLEKGNVSVIYNPVVSENLLNMANEQISHPWFEDDEIEVIIGVGRLSPEKDFITLLKSFKIVANERPEVRLIIAGDGSERDFLQNLVSELGIENLVEFAGYLENPYAYMHNSDLFVLSSKWEGFGIVLVEAMAVGTPVVSTDCPTGPSEILRDGEFGELVSVGEYEAMAVAIIETLENDSAPEKLKERANDFSTSVITSEYMDELDLDTVAE